MLVNENEIIMKPTGRISAVPLDPTYSKIWKNYNIQMSSFWVPAKVTLVNDAKHFKQMPADIRKATMMVLGYFAGSDEIVEEILSDSSLKDIQIHEMRYCLQQEVAMENIHSTTYNNIILAFEESAEKRQELFRSIETSPAVMHKAQWARKWINPQLPIDYTLIGKACVEGINFSSSFAWIDYLKTQDFKLEGLYLANREISRDEARHVQTSCLIHSHVVNKLSPQDAKKIIDEAIDIELEFVYEMIPPQGFIGMTRALMSEYVKHCAAILANDLGYPGLYGQTTCPFSFMMNRSLNIKSNFFETEEVEYRSFQSDEKLDDAFKDDDNW